MIDAEFCRQITTGVPPKDITSISMLSNEALALIRAFARQSRDAILEIGTYIGGATIPIAKGLIERGGGRLVCIERGGAYLTHPRLPSADIVTDWRKNIALAGVESIPDLIVGYSWSKLVIDTVARRLNGDPVGLVVIDADGFPGIALADYAHLFTSDCLVVVDDYVSPGGAAGMKPVSTKNQIDRAVERGQLECLGVYPFGTWFGRITRPVNSYLVGTLSTEQVGPWGHELRLGYRKFGSGFVERVPIASRNWQLIDDQQSSYRRGTSSDIIESISGRYAIEADQEAFLYFSPLGNPELNCRVFELVQADNA